MYWPKKIKCIKSYKSIKVELIDKIERGTYSERHFQVSPIKQVIIWNLSSFQLMFSSGALEYRIRCPMVSWMQRSKLGLHIPPEWLEVQMVKNPWFYNLHRFYELQSSWLTWKSDSCLEMSWNCTSFLILLETLSFVINIHTPKVWFCHVRLNVSEVPVV